MCVDRRSPSEGGSRRFKARIPHIRSSGRKLRFNRRCFEVAENGACSEAGMKRSLSAVNLISSDAERALQVQEVQKCIGSMSTGEVESYFNDGPSNQSRLSIPSNAQTSVISGNQFSGSGNVYNFNFFGK